MLRRPVGYVLLLLALVAALPAILLLLFLASGANVGSQGHLSAHRLVLEISLAAALVMGSHWVLVHARGSAQPPPR
jgi:hypothetical protein